MTEKPWKDWIPGVLSGGQLRILANQGYLDGVASNLTPDASSIDLHLTDEGYRLPQGSVKPFGDRYLSEIKNNNLSSSLKDQKDNDGAYILKPKNTYLFRLKEKLQGLTQASIYGQATAKSSIGRVDVLARLIVDGSDCYDSFGPDALKTGNGDMYLEVTPITFPVRVKAGISLSQLRLFYCSQKNAIVEGQELWDSLLHRDDGKNVDGSLSVDLSKAKVWGGQYSAFQAVKNTTPIDLWRRPGKPKPDPEDYWKPISCDLTNRLKIEKSHFYILRSKERISLPAGIAVYCRAIDETIGEMRIHYAGFVHPWFGKDRKDKQIGTPLIFEVRGHDVNVSLGNGEKMAWLTFYRMSEDSTKPDDDSYNNQTLELSRLFKKPSQKKRGRAKKM